MFRYLSSLCIHFLQIHPEIRQTILSAAILILVLLLLFTIGFIFTDRVIKQRQQRKRAIKTDQVSDLLRKYLTGDMTAPAVCDKMTDNKISFAILVQLCRQLINKVPAEKDKKLIHLLESEAVQQQYRKKLFKADPAEILEGLQYFKMINEMSEEDVLTVKELTRHKKDYVAHASVAVLLQNMNSEHDGMFDYIADRIQGKEELLIELMYQLRANPEVSLAEKTALFAEMLENERSQCRIKVLLINLLGEFTEYPADHMLSDCIKKLVQAPASAEKCRVAGALVDALRKRGQCSYAPEVMQLAEQPDRQVREAAVRYFYDCDSGSDSAFLQQLISEGPSYLEKELAYHKHLSKQDKQGLTVATDKVDEEGIFSTEKKGEVL